MSEPPPSDPVGGDASAKPRLWPRFQSQPRWKRWTAYGATTVVALAVVGGIVGAGDEESGDDRMSPSTAVVPVTAVESSPAPTAISVTATSAPPSSTTETTTTASTTTTSTSTTTTTTTSNTSTTTTTTLAPTTTVPGSVGALDVLAFIPIFNEHGAGYDRDRFGYPADQDGDRCDTRAEVLIRDSSTPAQVDPVGCTVVAGDWDSAYDDRTWTDPAELEIDHVVALKEAHDSGAWQWSPERLTAYANDLQDPRSLRAVTAAVNASKGDADPSNWLPPNEAFHCTYLADWVAIKARWGLSMDQSEHGRIRRLLTNRCPDQVIAPWPQTPPATPTTTTTSPPPIRPIAPLPPPADDCDPSYPTVCIPPPPGDLDCADVPFDHFTVLPPDPHGFDGNQDGVGCES